MEYIHIINGFLLVALAATLAIAYLLRQQRDAAMRDVAAIVQRLTDIERKLERKEMNTEKQEDVGEQQTSGKTDLQGGKTISQGNTTISQGNTTISQGNTTISQGDTTILQGDTTISQGNTTILQGDTTISQGDLSGMNDEELFQYLAKVIKEQELYRWHDFNRSAVMQQFSLSAARVGTAFTQGGGQSLPEFVRNCRLDHACRLMVEQPTMSFVEVGNASGYQRTTTFYHDFKARFGMAPAEYRKLKVSSA